MIQLILEEIVLVIARIGLCSRDRWLRLKGLGVFYKWLHLSEVENSALRTREILVILLTGNRFGIPTP